MKDNAKPKEKNENLKFLSWQSERLAYVQRRINNPGRGGRCKSKRQLYACNTKKLLLSEDKIKQKESKIGTPYRTTYWCSHLRGIKKRRGQERPIS